MKVYHDLLRHILENGYSKDDRTGTGTTSVFGYQMRFDLSQGFPLVTTKKIHLKSVIYELLWFLKGDTNIKYLTDPSVLPDTGKSFAENVANGKAALPPCHALFQFYVADGKLSCQLYQRSADVFLGVPFNIASYALLTMMLAQVCDLRVGDFVHTFGDVHIYNNHREQVALQLSRTPRELPTMHLNPAIKDLFAFDYQDFRLEGYDPYPAIKAQVSV